jgi:hypothetical protein
MRGQIISLGTCCDEVVISSDRAFSRKGARAVGDGTPLCGNGALNVSALFGLS